MRLIKLGAVIKLSKGKKAENIFAENITGSQRFIQIDDLRNNNNLKYTLSKGTTVSSSDVVIAWDGANAGTIGLGLSGVIGSTLAKIQITDPNINPMYLGLFLRAKNTYLRSRNTGATIPHISKDALMHIDVPVPALNIQEEVIEKLEHADKLIQNRKHSMTLLEEYLRSVFLDMFGDPLANPKQFPLSKLETFYIDKQSGTKCGPFGSALKKDEYTDDGIPVWNMDNIALSGRMSLPFRMWISPEKYESLLAYSVQDGDVLISRAGTVGKMCVARIEGQSIISTNLIRVRFGHKLLPQYFVSLMNYCMDRLGRLKTGGDGSFTHMNTGVLDNLILPYPPIEQQEKFVEIYKKTQELNTEMAIQLAELDNSYHGLMQTAFNY